MATDSIIRFYIPDLLSGWPWLHTRNPAYEEVKAASSEWLKSFHAFDETSQRAFDLCDFNLLAALTYPFADEKLLRSGCDFLNWVFVFDEYTDVADPVTARQHADIVMDAVRNPNTPRQTGEFVGGEACRQFWALASKDATPNAQRRFIEILQEYVDSVVQESKDRAARHIPDVDTYIALRRNTAGTKPCFAILELGMDIPDEVMMHPIVQDLIICATDLILTENDIYSYNVEQAEDNHLHNLVTIVMNQYNLDLKGATEWIADYHNMTTNKFLSARKLLPTWGPTIDHQIQSYVNGLGTWVRGNEAWSFESWRYFRGQAAEVKKQGWVHLMPKTTDIIAVPKLHMSLELSRRVISGEVVSCDAN